MTASVLTFEPDGTAHGLYTELIPLHSLGRLHITRATSIEFDDPQQFWMVRDPAGRILFQHASRQTCLDWEHEHFNPKETP